MALKATSKEEMFQKLSQANPQVKPTTEWLKKKTMLLEWLTQHPDCNPVQML